MNKFKIGDKVRIRQWDDMAREFGTDSGDIIRTPIIFSKYMKHLCGKTARIIDIDSDMSVILSFDNSKGDTDWAYTIDMIEPVCDKKIVITTNGEDTIAKLYSGKDIVKTAIARCNPIDEFDFNTGANIAFERLFDGTYKNVEDFEVKYKRILDLFFNFQLVLRINNSKAYELFINECEKRNLCPCINYFDEPIYVARVCDSIVEIHNADDNMMIAHIE